MGEKLVPGCWRQRLGPRNQSPGFNHIHKIIIFTFILSMGRPMNVVRRWSRYQAPKTLSPSQLAQTDPAQQSP